MSVEAIAVVLHHSLAVGTDKVVLIGIANHEGDGGSYPAIATLVKYARVSRRNVQKAIERLVDAGEVRVDVGSGGGRSTPSYARPNLYRIRVKCPPECDRTTAHRMPGDRGYDDGSAGVAAVVNDPPSQPTPPVAGDTGSPPVAGDGGSPDDSDAPPLSPATPEPSLEPPTQPAGKASTPQPPSLGGPGCATHGPSCQSRACGTSPRQVALIAKKRTEAERRQQAAAAVLAERARLEALMPTPERRAELGAQIRASLLSGTDRQEVS